MKFFSKIFCIKFFLKKLWMGEGTNRSHPLASCLGNRIRFLIRFPHSPVGIKYYNHLGVREGVRPPLVWSFRAMSRLHRHTIPPWQLGFGVRDIKTAFCSIAAVEQLRSEEIRLTRVYLVAAILGLEFYSSPFLFVSLDTA